MISEEEIDPSFDLDDIVSICRDKNSIEYIIAEDYCISPVNNCEAPDHKYAKLIVYSLKDKQNNWFLLFPILLNIA